MKVTLPDFPKIEIKQDTSLPDEAILADFDAMIWIMDGGDSAHSIQTARDEADESLSAVAEQALERHPADSELIYLNHPATNARVALLRPETAPSPFQALTLARQAIAGLLTDRPSRIAVLNLGQQHNATADTLAEALVSALHAALFQLPRLGKPAPPPPIIQAMHFHRFTGAPDFSRTEATAEGNNLARWLTHMPPNQLTPGHYRELAETLAKREGWKSRFLDRKQLKREGAGAFLSVVEASPNDDAGILHLQYRPSGSDGSSLALVGKGICFDTGGTNLKNAGGMLGMHGDMQGSAVALGTLLALTRLNFPHPVDCWLALAENHIGSKASKCNDVVTAVDGTTIEIINTDAEGRMVLADTLALASRKQPRAILDYATLTGSCVAALGHRMSGAMSNRSDWTLPLIESGERSGERVWPLPYARDYDQDLKSEVADVLQCRAPAEADHLYAARFLGRFVPDDIGWVHVDLSSGSREGGLAHIPSDTTGFGVRFGVDWLNWLVGRP
ncbi:leucyl aminopeptidase [Natronospira proteinivora]|uniref:Leucyl aminopeptidase n=1 Tax=Natronospira proteinivora TaxID=1807133 RepID=A0ABT1G4M9_9GAMM|nr:leucyl aminopeptidase family protein [Natronospira proteinivora]MCP1726245.1 leucyl aminopeptidase [Natronospira proteinivora]